MNQNIGKVNKSKPENIVEAQQELEENVTNMLEKLLSDGDLCDEVDSLSTMSTANAFGEVSLPVLLPSHSEVIKSKIKSKFSTLHDTITDYTTYNKGNKVNTTSFIKENVYLSKISNSKCSLNREFLETRQISTVEISSDNLIDINDISNSVVFNKCDLSKINDSNFNASMQDITEEFYHCFSGKFQYLIKNFNGSKFLQNCLTNTNSEMISKIFKEIITAIPELIIHKYGNYFCQKFYFLLNYEEKIKFLNILKINFIQISSDKIGNYSLQTIIEKLTTDLEKLIIIEAVKYSNTLEYMAYEFNSVHVLEKIIACFQEEQIIFIYEFVINNFLVLSINQVGLCIVKRAIIHARSFLILRKIQSILINNFQYLIQNTYGNYTIQVAIEYWNNLLISPILKLFINKFSKFSILKFSSNVVEKCLEKGGHEFINIFVEEIVTSKKILQLIKNNYGNFVLQKVLMIASSNTKIVLINNILENLAKIEDKKLIIKWKHICDFNIGSIYRSSSFNINNINDDKDINSCKYYGNESCLL